MHSVGTAFEIDAAGCLAQLGKSTSTSSVSSN